MSVEEARSVTASEEHPLSTEEKEMAEKMCEGIWRLRENVVVRVEEDGVILFDPDTDAISVANPIGGALVQWRPERICFDEWCEALCKHYREEVNLPQIQADLKKFLGAISHFAEPCDGTSN